MPNLIQSLVDLGEAHLPAAEGSALAFLENLVSEGKSLLQSGVQDIVVTDTPPALKAFEPDEIAAMSALIADAASAIDAKLDAEKSALDQAAAVNKTTLQSIAAKLGTTS